jgi:hypothetical protein
LSDPSRAARAENGAAAQLVDFKMFWTALDQAAKDRGLTRLQWAERANGLSGRQGQTDRAEHKPFSSKTLADRIVNGRRVSWDETCWFVKAIDNLDEAEWKAAWERAESSGNGWHTNSHPTDDVPLSEQDHASIYPTPWWKRRAFLLIRVASFVIGGAAAGSAITLLAVQDPAQTRGIGCADVAVDKADVFRNPDGLESLTIKIRGERIRLPLELEEIEAKDGRRYRMVRAPYRTPSGYAYMLVDTLAVVDC